MSDYVIGSGVVSSGVTLNSGDTMEVLSGGTAFATTVDDGGSLTVSSGGLDEFATINSGGSETVVAGGSATSDAINDGGSQILFGVELSATINSGGIVNEQSGAIQAGTTINSGASEIVTAGRANNTIVQSGGLFTMATSDGAGAKVAKGGTMIVPSDGRPTDDMIDGTLIVTSGGSAGFGGTFPEVIRSGGIEIVSAGGSAGATTVIGSLTVLAGGFADATVENGGSAVIAGGGDFLGLNIPPRGTTGTGAATLTSGANVSAASVDAGTLTLSAGAAVSVALIDGGQTTVSSGGAITGSAVVGAAAFVGGHLTVLSGGTVFNPIVKGSGAVFEFTGGAVVSGGITFDNLSSPGGRVQIGGTTMPTAVISGWVNGDTVDLASVPFDPNGSSVLGSGNVLHFTEGGTTYNLNLSLAQFYGAFHLVADSGSGTLITEDPVCFCRGTLILTEDGEVAVEDLRVGDRVRTLSGEVKPIPLTIEPQPV